MIRRVRSFRRIVPLILFVGFLAFPITPQAFAQKPLTGYHKSVAVDQTGEIDGVFPLANQSPAELPTDWNPGYDATEQTFELYVPEIKSKPKAAKALLPLILFVSPGDEPLGWAQCEALCKQEKVCFASPYKAGNNCPGPRRVRIVLDVLDQLRRTIGIDPDRTYIAGFSGGGRIAQQVAGALPEYFGGAIPICAAELPREESWLRERIASRLNLAFITGDSDFNRGEVENWKGPICEEVGIRTHVWVVPNLGHGVPSDKTLAEAFAWLEEGKKDRTALAKRWPATSVDPKTTPDRAAQAQSLSTEAEKRLKTPATLYSGLMQLKGIAARWPDLPEADAATKLLLEYDAKDERPWDMEDIAEQRKYLIAEARGLTAYVNGDLPPQYLAMKPRMATAALAMWKQILDDGQDAKAVAEAKRWIPELSDLAGK
jgi:pimeloyl-ACP methyl ester carboxylesterase